MSPKQEENINKDFGFIGAHVQDSYIDVNVIDGTNDEDEGMSPIRQPRGPEQLGPETVHRKIESTLERIESTLDRPPMLPQMTYPERFSTEQSDKQSFMQLQGIGNQVINIAKIKNKGIHL